MLRRSGLSGRGEPPERDLWAFLALEEAAREIDARLRARDLGRVFAGG